MKGTVPPTIKPDKDEAFAKDWNARMSLRDMGRKYGVTPNTISTHAGRLKLPYRGRWPKDYEPKNARYKKKSKEAEQYQQYRQDVCFVCCGATGGRCGCAPGWAA
jgi:uncharacterized protein YjcR